ncbi:MAG: hypothetical protein D6675_13180 [Gemmatimonadetes bacterium]|nr:MAG: hypothetical protein D6675_13180 [Gemmatimonadota bacterium]
MAILRILNVGLLVLVWFAGAPANTLERFANSLPVFAASAGIQSQTDTLTIGVFSESDVPAADLDVFKSLKTWDAELVQNVTQHNHIEVIPLQATTLETFEGQIIWVLDATPKSLKLLKTYTEKGIFTIGMLDENYQNFLFTTLIYENKSDDPTIERWRLVKLIANCEISPLSYSKKLRSKPYFTGNGCE